MQEELTATNYKAINDNYKRHCDDGTKLLALYKGRVIHGRGPAFFRDAAGEVW